jgi:hypothetical protein
MAEPTSQWVRPSLLTVAALLVLGLYYNGNELLHTQRNKQVNPSQTHFDGSDRGYSPSLQTASSPSLQTASSNLDLRQIDMGVVTDMASQTVVTNRARHLQRYQRSSIVDRHTSDPSYTTGALSETIVYRRIDHPPSAGTLSEPMKITKVRGMGARQPGSDGKGTKSSSSSTMSRESSKQMGSSNMMSGKEKSSGNEKGMGMGMGMGMGKGKRMGMGMGSKKSSSEKSSEIRIRVPDFYLAYVTPLLVTKPTEEQVTGLVDVTEQFWDELFERLYDGTTILYRGTELVVDEDFFNTGIPEERFNYYINFNTTVLYEDNSRLPPGPEETFEIMASADFEDYVSRFVRTQPAFNSTTEVAFRAQESSDGPTLTPTLSPTDSPTQILNLSPTTRPTLSATTQPGLSPTARPTDSPSQNPTAEETVESTGTEEPDNVVKTSESSEATAELSENPSEEREDSAAKQLFVGDHELTAYSAVPNVRIGPASNVFRAQEPGGASTLELLGRIDVNDYYLAFVTPLLVTEPTDEQIARLVDLTAQFWDAYFSDYYKRTKVLYRGIELSMEEDFLNKGIPEERFNYRINFSTTFLFDTNAQTPSDPALLFDVMASVVFENYILKFVGTLPTFKSTNEVVFRAQE